MSINKIEQPHGVMWKDFYPINSVPLNSKTEVILLMKYYILFSAFASFFLYMFQCHKWYLATHCQYALTILMTLIVRNCSIKGSLHVLYFLHFHLHINLVNLIISWDSFSSLFASSSTFQTIKFTSSYSRNSKLKWPL